MAQTLRAGELRGAERCDRRRATPRPERFRDENPPHRADSARSPLRRHQQRRPGTADAERIVVTNSLDRSHSLSKLATFLGSGPALAGSDDVHIDERVSLAPSLSPLPSLRPFDPRVLEVDPAVICALTEDLRISFVNEAWASFAKDNGARWGEGEWGVGTRILDAVPRVLQPFYRRLFDGVLHSREETEHDYECSSVSQQRRFRMTIYPCVSGGLVLVHSLVSEVPQRSTPSSEEPSSYRDGHGLVHQCCHCRRVRRANDPAAWDWVPAFVDGAPSNVSHGLCRVCAQYHYPPSGDLES